MPATARNIQYKKFSLWLAYEVYVRFEAPVEDCLAHARATINDFNARCEPDLRVTSSELTPITQPPHHPHLTVSVPWFDVEEIQEGVCAGDGSPSRPRIWVDTARGVFYCLMAD